MENVYNSLASVASFPLTLMYYGLAASRERPSPLVFLHTTFFYLPEATVEMTQTTGTKQEVDFRNKSVEINPGVKTVLPKTVLGNKKDENCKCLLGQKSVLRLIHRLFFFRIKTITGHI